MWCPPPTIARNTALHIATGGRCGMYQQAIIVKVHTVLIVNNSFILLRFRNNMDHKRKWISSHQRQDIANCGTYITQSFSESSLVAALYPKKFVDTLQVITCNYVNNFSRLLQNSRQWYYTTPRIIFRICYHAMRPIVSSLPIRLSVSVVIFFNRNETHFVSQDRIWYIWTK